MILLEVEAAIDKSSSDRVNLAALLLIGAALGGVERVIQILRRRQRSVRTVCDYFTNSNVLVPNNENWPTLKKRLPPTDPHSDS